ncbi:hypothetical protein QYM36_008342 [Artemia franciscana]|uniref:Uncharacterized protein n=1 Tax=Artemia franciscana TaxID=6661 RepID=A0AA88IGC3_ARTSF|nr:hypothetical protein QYM36_008342 [Artemia franciscana]
MKCHQTRSLEKNQQTARELLLMKFDNLMNGEMSVELQKKKNLKEKVKRSKMKGQKAKEKKEKSHETIVSL